MLADDLPFPSTRPQGYEPLGDEPVFDPKRHLALEPPSKSWTLNDFGYSKEETGTCASQIAIAGPIRLLSEQGAEAARAVAAALRGSRQTSDRTANYLAGGVYRSRFLRDLCNCPQVTAFLSDVAGCELLPHSMPSQQLYINYAPDDLGKAVDTWHTDSIGFDCVILATDPATFSGGQFQFFRGTRQEAASLLETRPEELTAPIRQRPAQGTSGGLPVSRRGLCRVSAGHDGRTSGDAVGAPCRAQHDGHRVCLARRRPPRSDSRLDRRLAGARTHGRICPSQGLAFMRKARLSHPSDGYQRLRI